MYCKFCGHQIADNSVFCSSCGKNQINNNEELKSSKTNAPLTSQPPLNPITVNKVNKGEVTFAKEIIKNIKFLIIGVGIALLIYFIFRFGYFYPKIQDIVNDSSFHNNLMNNNSNSLGVPYCALTEGLTAHEDNVKEFMVQRADSLSETYALYTFLFSALALIFGRYLIKGLSWVNKTAKNK